MLLEITGLIILSGILWFVIRIFVARQYTLRAKLVTAFMVILLTSLTALVLFNSAIMRQNLTSAANNALSLVAKKHADRIDHFNHQNTHFLTTEAALPTINYFIKRQAEPPYTRHALLQILRALQSRDSKVIYSYAILNAQGINILDTASENTGTDESQHAYFSVFTKPAVADTTNTVLNGYRSPVIFDETRSTIVFSSAINDLSGRLIGVLRAKYHASVLTSLFDHNEGIIGHDSFAVLLDENNLRLVHSKHANLAFTLASEINKSTLEELKRNHRLPKTITSDFFEHAAWPDKIKRANASNPIIKTPFFGLGTAVYSSAVVRLETAPWTIVVSLPQDVFLEPVTTQMQNALIVVLIIVLLVVLVVMLATRLLLGPVKRLTAVVENITKGDRSIKAKVEADDEIGDLARAFNKMTASINHLIIDLEDEVGSHKLTAENLNKLSQAIEQSPVSVIITDLEGKIEYVNPQLCKITGYKEQELIGKNPRILSSGSTSALQYKNMWHAITTGQSWTGELHNKKKNGELFWENVTISAIKNNKNKNTHYLAIKEDISIRKDYEERLLYQASYDKLTNLPNRALAYDRIQQAIVNAIREKEKLALLYMDFDHFKNINDTLGHSAGDEFLTYMAGRLKACIQDFDTVARLGGDEFLIMLLENNNPSNNQRPLFEKNIELKAADILQRVSQPCIIQGMEFSVTASIGIAIFPRDGDDPHVLLKCADTAMYRSKRKGRNTFEVFTPEMGDVVMKRVEIDSKLRRALENGDFHLQYQPLLDINKQRVVAAEALIRWQDAELGNVSPEEFVPLAEESGLIVEIGDWVFDTAFADVKKWREQPEHKNFYIAINLSSRQFRGKDIVKKLAASLKRFGLPGSCLELEITERLIMKDVPHVVAILNQFKAMGIRLSIDDFGTGYSSLSYLKRFPFDVLKIDKIFIKDIASDSDDRALCDAIIAMAHSLGLSVIGEGVETKQQYEFLSQRGVETVQGYYVSAPMISEDFQQSLTGSNWLQTATQLHIGSPS